MDLGARAAPRRAPAELHLNRVMCACPDLPELHGELAGAAGDHAVQSARAQGTYRTGDGGRAAAAVFDCLIVAPFWPAGVDNDATEGGSGQDRASGHTPAAQPRVR